MTIRVNILEKRKLTWLLLFIGFCCVFGWLASNFILLTHYTNSRHFETSGATLQTILGCLIYTSFYIVIGAAAFIWGVERYKRTARQGGLILGSLIPAAVLTPFLGIAGMAVLLFAPFLYGHARTFIAGPKVVQSADSPDGAWRAYVVDKPSIDGPNHHLYVKDAATGQSAFVTNLPEDVDFSREILWSPHSDLVVFRTHFTLIAFSPQSRRKAEVVLGGERHYRQNGTFWVDYEDVKEIRDLQFPAPGTLTYRFEGDDITHAVNLEAG